MTEVLRPGVLAGVRVRVAGAGELGDAVAARFAALGAEEPAGPHVNPAGPHGDPAGPNVNPAGPHGDPAGPNVNPAGEGGRGVDVVVWDGAAAFSSAPGVLGVRAALDDGWDAIRGSMASGQLILLLAPRPGDAHAEAARAGLENMARTLSVEWARLGIRPVAIHPGAATPAGEVAEIAAYLASPAGAFYSGCRFDLGSVEA